MSIQPTNNTQTLSYSEKVTNDISKAAAWLLIGATGFIVSKAVQALIPAEQKEIAEKAGQAAQAVLAGGIIGAGVQVKDHANMLPTLDLVASYIKPVVKPIVNGVEFVGSSAVAGTTYAWNSAMNAIGYGAVKAVQSPAAQPVPAKTPAAASKGIFW